MATAGPRAYDRVAGLAAWAVAAEVGVGASVAGECGARGRRHAGDKDGAGVGAGVGSVAHLSEAGLAVAGARVGSVDRGTAGSVSVAGDTGGKRGLAGAAVDVGVNGGA